MSAVASSRSEEATQSKDPYGAANQNTAEGNSDKHARLGNELPFFTACHPEVPPETVSVVSTKEPELIVVSGGSKRDVRRTYDNYRKLLGRSIKRSAFFSSDLTQEAVDAICH